MMQECPRCGFVQPEDRFCANCGLDIENYSPKKPTLVKQFLQSSGLLLSTLVIVLLAMVGGIYWHQSQQIESQLTEPTTAANSAPDAVPEPKPEVVTPPPAAAAPTARTAKAITPPVAKVLSKKAPSEEIAPREEVAKPAVSSSPTTLSVRFAEISRTSLESLFSSAQIISESGSERTATIRTATSGKTVKVGGDVSTGPDVAVEGTAAKSNFNSLSSGTSYLPGGSEKGLSINEPHNFEFISAVPGPAEGSPEEELGLSLQILPSQLSGTEVTLEVTGVISLREESSGNIITVDLSGSYNFDASETLMISGFVPHQKISENDVNYFSGSPLVILNSEEFMNENNEFLIVIQAK